MKKDNGTATITLIIIIIVIAIIAGITIKYTTSDKGLVNNTLKMDIDTVKGEVRDQFLSLLNIELVSASEDIKGSSVDISTRYNEIKLINFLKGNLNYEGTEHVENDVIKCIEEFEGDKDEVIDLIPKAGEGVVKSKYRIIASALCPEGNKYGTGKHIIDGNIFTLEAIIGKDENDNDVYEGKFELKYYDKDHKETVIETVDLYLTNQS